MSNEISKNLICILMRSGIEIWIDAEKFDNLQESLEKNRFIRIVDQIINSADVSGVFDAKTMEEKTRRKNGQWKCHANYWHNKGEECAHRK